VSYTFADFERFARKLTLDSGKPLKLEPFQKEILRDHFGPARGLTVIIPKKNYKTTTMAAVALFHLHETKQADVPILASSSKQAGIMFRQAANFVRNSGTKVKGTGYRQNDLKDVFELDGLQYEIRTGLREIRANGGLLYVVASDTDRIDGVIPSLAMVDELHRHRNGENYGVLSDGLGPRKARIITISTAGASEDSPLGLLRKNAHKYRNRTVDDRHTRYSEGTNVLHEWALTDEDDPENLHDVKRVNPAKVNNLTELKRRRTEPLMTPGRWLRFGCGIWTAGDEPAITAPEWDRLYADNGQVREGDEVVLAPSVGHTAAIGIVAVRDGGRAAVRAEVIDPVEGRSILAMCEDRLVELCDTYRVREVQHPVGGFIRSAELLEARGVPMVEAPHSPARLTAASGTFDRMRRSELLIHDGDPVLRKHVLAAQLKVSEQGERYVIGERSRAVIAVMMAVHAATAYYPVPYVGSPTVGVW
jgi:phage terminase large subunit-like protein